jgi:uncharacterized protein
LCSIGLYFKENALSKLLVLIVLGVAIYLLFKNYQRSLNRPDSTTPAERGPEDMVKCAHCGVNLPRSEAIFSQGEFFCTAEHQRLGRK